MEKDSTKEGILRRRKKRHFQKRPKQPEIAIRSIFIRFVQKYLFQTKEISEMDIRAIFRMIDVDKSGNISRTVRIEILQDNDDGNDDAGDYHDYDDLI